MPGFFRYDDDFVVLTRIKRPMWLPVSQERFIRSEIRTWKARLSEVEPAASISPHERWLKDRARRASEAEKAYEEMRRVDPKAAEAYRAQAAKTEKEVAERLQAEDANYRAGSSNGVAAVRRQVEALEAELAALSPAARIAAAFYLGSIHRGARPSGLAEADAEGARPVVMPNRDFFDPGRPKTSLQLLAVKIEPRIEDLRDHVSHFPWTNDVFNLRLLRDVTGEVDWKRLAALLD